MGKQTRVVGAHAPRQGRETTRNVARRTSCRASSQEQVEALACCRQKACLDRRRQTSEEKCCCERGERREESQRCQRCQERGEERRQKRHQGQEIEEISSHQLFFNFAPILNSLSPILI